MNMSGMGYGNVTCTSVSNWTSASEPWTKVPGDNAANATRRNISDNVTTSKTTDMYDRGVISSTSPPVMAAEGNQNQSRLRSLLTKAKEMRHSKEIHKGVLKGQPSTNNANTEGNFVLKGLLNSGVVHQDDHLLNSLGFGTVRSPSTCNPNSPQTARSPVFSQNSPMCEMSPQSYNSPSPTGSSKRGGDDDIYIERQIIKKKCYSPPAFHSLPSSSAPPAGKDGTNASAICEKNKMLAKLLATQPTTPATIPPLPQSVLTATPQERLQRLPGRPRQNSTASWSGGTIKLIEPGSPPLATSPKVDEYDSPVISTNLMQHRQESYPVNTQTLTPVPIPSSPESGNCYPNLQPSNQMVDQRNCAVNQQRPYSCNQEESWQNYCGQQSQLPSTSVPVQDNRDWHKQLTAQRKLSIQSQEDTVSGSNNYNSVTTSQYSSTYHSYNYYNQQQMGQSQDNNAMQPYLMQQQQMMMQQRYCAQQKEYFSVQNQQFQQQQMTGWGNYSRDQASSMPYSNFQGMRQGEALRQNFRGTNYQEPRNSYQEYWDMQNLDTEPSSGITNMVEYNQSKGQTNNEQEYLRGDTADSTVLGGFSSRLLGSEDVPSKYHRLRNGGPNEQQQMPQYNPNFMMENEDLPVLGTNDNDLSGILDYILEVETPDNNGLDLRRQPKNNRLLVPDNSPPVHPNVFSYNNYNSYDAQSCV